MCCIFTGDYSAIKKEFDLAISNSMDEPRRYYAKWSKRKTNAMIALTCRTKNRNLPIYTENWWLLEGKG